VLLDAIRKKYFLWIQKETGYVAVMYRDEILRKPLFDEVIIPD
jgi:hypothetical protein